MPLCRRCSLDSSSMLEDRRNFAGKRHLVSWLSWFDFCDQLIANANPIVSRALAHRVRRSLLDECIEPAVIQTYMSLGSATTYTHTLLESTYGRTYVRTSLHPQKVSSILMTFGVYVEVDAWCTTVCSMTRSKVKVTSLSKFEIRPFSKAVFSAIYKGSWRLSTDSETRA